MALCTYIHVQPTLRAGSRKCTVDLGYVQKRPVVELLIIKFKSSSYLHYYVALVLIETFSCLTSSSANIGDLL